MSVEAMQEAAWISGGTRWNFRAHKAGRCISGKQVQWSALKVHAKPVLSCKSSHAAMDPHPRIWIPTIVPNPASCFNQFC